MAINFIPFPVVQPPNWKANKRRSWSRFSTRAPPASGRWWLLAPRPRGDRRRPAGVPVPQSHCKGPARTSPERERARGRRAGLWRPVLRDTGSVNSPATAGLLDSGPGERSPRDPLLVAVTPSRGRRVASGRFTAVHSRGQAAQRPGHGPHNGGQLKRQRRQPLTVPARVHCRAGSPGGDSLRRADVTVRG